MILKKSIDQEKTKSRANLCKKIKKDIISPLANFCKKKKGILSPLAN